MKIALVGYGKMGKMVEECAVERGHIVASKVGRTDWPKEMEAHNLDDIDVYIEFTHPDAVLENIRRMAKHKKNMVIGTTGWYEHLDEVKKIVEENEVGLLYAQNFSIGMYLFTKLIEETAKRFSSLSEYSVAISEMHHEHKADRPSGTAKLLAEKVGNDPEVSTLRIGSEMGTHSVYFDSEDDRITCTHQAKARDGFARGAVLAAEWIRGKKGLFTIEDLMEGR